MCIAIYCPSNEVITKEIAEESAKSNPDGQGFAYTNEEKKIVVVKSMKFDEFWEEYTKAIAEFPDSQFLIHFRIATHGRVDKETCHPYMINDDHVLIHNGTITNAPLCPDNIHSDTQMFIDETLKYLPDSWLFNDGISDLIEHSIGNSKLVIMDNEGSIRIYNEDKGHWKDNIWFSNHSYKPRQINKPTNYNYGGKDYSNTKYATENGVKVKYQYGARYEWGKNTLGHFTWVYVGEEKKFIKQIEAPKKKKKEEPVDIYTDVCQLCDLNTAERYLRTVDFDGEDVDLCTTCIGDLRRANVITAEHKIRAYDYIKQTEVTHADRVAI